MITKPLIVLTAEQKALAVGLAATGKGLPDIIKALGVDPSTFSAIKERDPDFAKIFQSARAEGMEHLADSLLTVVEDKPDVAKARVHSENVRWLLSKRQPQIYGDRIDMNVTQNVDISAALLEARRRALPGNSPSHELDEQPRDVAEVSSVSATDRQSVAAPAKPTPDNGDDDIFG